jgi:hypothetical protein
MSQVYKVNLDMLLGIRKPVVPPNDYFFELYNLTKNLADNEKEKVLNLLNRMIKLINKQGN